ncbi:MAG: recombinase family protein [Lachnospiraceae bacterium]|nr:recombinase family protein [Lachnospiraceae bacterium]
MAGQFLAEYLRLSVEDGDMISNEAKAESDSISHQRELITRYINDKRIYPAIQPLEFVDDGYSGTNFDRPAVREMLSLVREGKICCIIVKDLSRFGRNYLEVGDYLEQIFPFLGVRFIAINDGYDSDDHIGTTGGIEIAFKSLLYDMYSKDLSEKMRSSLLIRRKRGDFIGPRAPFGYRFSDNKKVLAVDEVAAQYVKQIFKLACEGCGTGKIAKLLNKEKIPTPGQYKNREKLQYHIMDGEGYWDSGKVRKILQNKVYLGIIVNGRTRVTEVGGSHFKQVPDEEQICVPGRHEAIITEQEYHHALEAIKNNGCQKGKKHTPKQQSILLGKLRCGHCKRSLLRLDCTTIPCFICKKTRYKEDNMCISERLSEPELETAIIERINEELEQGILAEKSQDRKSDMILSAAVDRQLRKMRIALKKKRDSLKIEKQYLYEQYKRDQIERETYLHRVKALREEENRLSEQIQKLQEEREHCGQNDNSQQEQTGKLESLTREVVDEWIDRIYVYGESRIDIVYKEKIKKSKKSIKNC